MALDFNENDGTDWQVETHRSFTLKQFDEFVLKLLAEGAAEERQKIQNALAEEKFKVTSVAAIAGDGTTLLKELSNLVRGLEAAAAAIERLPVEADVPTSCNCERC